MVRKKTCLRKCENAHRNLCNIIHFSAAHLCVSAKIWQYSIVARWAALSKLTHWIAWHCTFYKHNRANMAERCFCTSLLSRIYWRPRQETCFLFPAYGLILLFFVLRKTTFSTFFSFFFLFLILSVFNDLLLHCIFLSKSVMWLFVCIPHLHFPTLFREWLPTDSHHFIKLSVRSGQM